MSDVTVSELLEKLNQKQKKREFSKMHVVFANVLVAIVYIGSFILAWFEKPGTEVMHIALAIVTAYGAFATGGYFAQNMFRAGSLNKLKEKHVEHHVSPEEAHYD